MGYGAEAMKTNVLTISPEVEALIGAQVEAFLAAIGAEG